jgi:hypothetical protein
VDTRGLKWKPLSRENVERLLKEASSWVWSSEEGHGRFRSAIVRASESGLDPPQFESCLLDNETQVRCKQNYPSNNFWAQYLEELRGLACQSRDIARGLLSRNYYGYGFSRKQDSAMKGFALYLKNIIEQGVREQTCPGLTSLTEADKELMRYLAEQKPQ